MFSSFPLSFTGEIVDQLISEMSFDEKADIVKGTAYSVNVPRRFHCTVSSFGSGWIEFA